MIKYVIGDLLESDCDVIAHQANCFKTMGAGISGAIIRKYPIVADVDQIDPRLSHDRFGSYSCTREMKPNIYNLYGQYAPGAHTHYMALESALLNMMIHLTDPDAKIGVPYKMGCGIGGGDWTRVHRILERVSESSERTIFVYVLPQFAHEVELLSGNN